MKNATRRMKRAAKRAYADLGGLGTAEKPLVLTEDNVGLFVRSTAVAMFQNPKTLKYRKAQKRREAAR